MELIVAKVEKKQPDQHGSPSGFQDRHDREVRVHVEARGLEGMKKEALVNLENPEGSVFRMRCDEAPSSPATTRPHRPCRTSAPP